MHREGHLGVALAAYAPIGVATAIQVSDEIALLGAGLAAALATLPDVDTRVPVVVHRGYSHTVWFALVVGAVCGFVAATLEPAGWSLGVAERGALAALIGTTSVCSHVAADALTPMGVRPFAPFGDRYSLGLVRASNRVANLLLLVFGVCALVGAFALAARLG